MISKHDLVLSMFLVTVNLTQTFPRYDSAVSFIFVKTIDEISSGKNVFVSPLYWTLIFGLPPSFTTSNGQWVRSAVTVLSSNFLPINRLASVLRSNSYNENENTNIRLFADVVRGDRKLGFAFHEHGKG